MKTFNEIAGLNEEVTDPEQDAAKIKIKYNIDKLETEFNKLKTINPMSPTWKKVEKLIDSMPPEALKVIADSRIKFLWSAALTTLKYKHGINHSIK